jgi:hypothetical protein
MRSDYKSERYCVVRVSCVYGLDGNIVARAGSEKKAELGNPSEKNKNRKTVKALFLPMLLDLRKSITCSETSHASPVCPSGRATRS